MPNMPRWYSPPQDKITQRIAERSLGNTIYQNTRKAVFTQTLFYTIASIFYIAATLPLIISHLIISDAAISRFKRIKFTVQNFIRSLVNIAGFPIYLLTALIIPKTMARQFVAVPLSALEEDAKNAPNIGQEAATAASPQTKPSPVPDVAELWQEDHIPRFVSPESTSSTIQESGQRSEESEGPDEEIEKFSEGHGLTPSSMMKVLLKLVTAAADPFEPSPYDVMKEMGNYLALSENDSPSSLSKNNYNSLIEQLSPPLEEKAQGANNDPLEAFIQAIENGHNNMAICDLQFMFLPTLNLSSIFESLLEKKRPAVPPVSLSNLCIIAKKKEDKLCITIHAQPSMLKEISTLTRTVQSEKQLGSLEYTFKDVEELKNNKNVLSLLFNARYKSSGDIGCPIHPGWIKNTLNHWSSFYSGSSFIRYSGLQQEKKFSPIQHAIGDLLGNSPYAKKALKSCFQYLVLCQKLNKMYKSSKTQSTDYAHLLSDAQKLAQKQGSSHFTSRALLPLINEITRIKDEKAITEHANKGPITPNNITEDLLTMFERPDSKISNASLEQNGPESVSAPTLPNQAQNSYIQHIQPLYEWPLERHSFTSAQELGKYLNGLYQIVIQINDSSFLQHEQDQILKEDAIRRVLHHLNAITSFKIENENPTSTSTELSTQCQQGPNSKQCIERCYDLFNELGFSLIALQDNYKQLDFEISATILHLIKTVGDSLFQKKHEGTPLEGIGLDLNAFHRERFDALKTCLDNSDPDHTHPKNNTLHALCAKTFYASRPPATSQNSVDAINISSSKKPNGSNEIDRSSYTNNVAAQYEWDSTTQKFKVVNESWFTQDSIISRLYGHILTLPENQSSLTYEFPNNTVSRLIEEYYTTCQRLIATKPPKPIPFEKEPTWDGKNKNQSQYLQNLKNYQQSPSYEYSTKIDEIKNNLYRAKENLVTQLKELYETSYTDFFKNHPLYNNLNNYGGITYTCRDKLSEINWYINRLPDLLKSAFGMLKLDKANFNCPLSVFPMYYKLELPHITIDSKMIPDFHENLTVDESPHPPSLVNDEKEIPIASIEDAFKKASARTRLCGYSLLATKKTPVSPKSSALNPLTAICAHKDQATSSLLSDRLFSCLSFNPVGANELTESSEGISVLRRPPVFLNRDPDGLSTLHEAYQIWGSYPALHLRVLEDRSLLDNLLTFLSPLLEIETLMGDRSPSTIIPQTLMIRSHLYRVHALRSLLFHVRDHVDQLSDQAKENLAKVDDFLFKFSGAFTQTIINLHKCNPSLVDKKRLMVILAELMLSVYLVKDHPDQENKAYSYLLCLIAAFHKLNSQGPIEFHNNRNKTLATFSKETTIYKLFTLFKETMGEDLLPAQFFSWLLRDFTFGAVDQIHVDKDAAPYLYLPDSNDDHKVTIRNNDNHGMAVDINNSTDLTWCLNLNTGELLKKHPISNSWFVANDEYTPPPTDPKIHPLIKKIFGPTRSQLFTQKGSSYQLSSSDGTFIMEGQILTWTLPDDQNPQKYRLDLSKPYHLPIQAIDYALGDIIDNEHPHFLIWEPVDENSDKKLLVYIQYKKEDGTPLFLKPLAFINENIQNNPYHLEVLTGWLKDSSIIYLTFPDQNRLKAHGLITANTGNFHNPKYKIFFNLADSHGNILRFDILEDNQAAFATTYHRGIQYIETPCDFENISLSPLANDQDQQKPLPYMILQDYENYQTRRKEKFLLCVNLSSITKDQNEISDDQFLHKMVPDRETQKLGRYINIAFEVNDKGEISFDKQSREDYLVIAALHLATNPTDFTIVLDRLREWTELCLYPLSRDELALLRYILDDLTNANKPTLDSAGFQALMLAGIYYEGYHPDSKPIEWNKRLPKDFEHFDLSRPFLPNHLPFVPSSSHLPYYLSSLQKLGLTATTYESRSLTLPSMDGQMLFNTPSILDRTKNLLSQLPFIGDSVENFMKKISEFWVEPHNKILSFLSPKGLAIKIEEHSSLSEDLIHYQEIVTKLSSDLFSNTVICNTLKKISSQLAKRLLTQIPTKKEKAALASLADNIAKLANHPALSLPFGNVINQLCELIIPSTTFALPLFLTEWIKVWLCDRPADFQRILKNIEFKADSSFFTELAKSTDFMNWSSTVKFNKPSSPSITASSEPSLTTSFMPSKPLAIHAGKPAPYQWPNQTFIDNAHKSALNEDTDFGNLFNNDPIPSSLENLVAEIAYSLPNLVKLQYASGSRPPFAAADLLRLFMSKNDMAWEKTLGVTDQSKIQKWKDALALILENKIRTQLIIQNPDTPVHSWLSREDEQKLWAQYPHILAFEAILGKTLRKNQVDTIQGLVKWDDKQGFIFQNTFYQLMMGAGKSKVIAPILAMIYATAFPDKIPLMTYTAPLFASCTVDLQQTLSPFGINVKALSLNRTHLESLAGTRITLLEIARAYENGNTILTCQAKDIQLLFSMMPILHTRLDKARNTLKDHESDTTKHNKDDIAKEKRNIDDTVTHITFVARILKLMADKALFTMDEMDHVLYPLHELILSLGTKTTPPSIELDATLDINLELLEIPLFREKLKDDSLSSLTDQEKIEIKKALAQKLFRKWSIENRLNLTFDQWLSYLSIVKESNSYKINKKTFKSLAKQYGDHKKTDLVNKVSILRFIVEDAFDTLCDKKAGVSHGLSPFTTDQMISTPWRDGAPQHNAQFQNSIMTIVLTNFLHLVRTDLSPLFAKNFIRFCVMQVYGMSGKPSERIRLLRDIASNCNIDLDPFIIYMQSEELNETAIVITDDLIENMRHRLLKVKDETLSDPQPRHKVFIEWFLKYTTHKISGEEVQIYPEIVQSNSADLLAISHHLSSPSSQGFSGTTSATGWVPERALTKNIDTTIVSTIQSALQQSNKCIVLEGGEPLPDWNISSFIDLGAQKRREPVFNTVMALTEQYPNKNYFIYYDENSSGQTVVHVWNRSTQLSTALEGSDHKMIAQVCGVNNLDQFKQASFCFYPFQNIIGSDLPNPQDGAAIVTFDDATDERLLAQSVMRMRELIDGKDANGGVLQGQGGQKIIFQITTLVAAKIRTSLGKDENQPLTVDNLFLYAKKIEEGNDAQFNLTGTINRLKAVIRAEMHQYWFSLFEKASPLTDESLLNYFKYFEQFLVAQTLDDPFIRFGAPTKEGVAIKLLNIVVHNIGKTLQVIKRQDPKLYEALTNKLKAEHKAILSELNKKKFSLPKSVRQTASPDDGDGSVTVSTETSVAVSTEQEVQVELSTLCETITPVDPKGKIKPFRLPLGQKYLTLHSPSENMGANWSANDPEASKTLFGSLMKPQPLFNNLSSIEKDVVADLNNASFFSKKSRKNFSINSLIKKNPFYKKYYKHNMVSDNIYVSRQFFEMYDNSDTNNQLFMTEKGQPMQYLLTVEEKGETYAIVIRAEEADCIKTVLDYYTNIKDKPSLNRHIALMNIQTGKCIGSTERESINDSTEDEKKKLPSLFENANLFLLQIYLLTNNELKLAEFFLEHPSDKIDQMIREWRAELNTASELLKQYQEFAPKLQQVNKTSDVYGSYNNDDNIYDQHGMHHRFQGENRPFLSKSYSTAKRSLLQKMFKPQL